MLAAIGDVAHPTWRGFSAGVYRLWATAATEAARRAGVLAVEMEAAALYAFAEVRHVPVVCFAHVTNQVNSCAVLSEPSSGPGSAVWS